MKIKKITNLGKNTETTYNLHIRSDHNYVANGIVASNCHQGKAEVIKKLLTGPFAHCPIRFGLTGTIPKAESDQKSLLASIGPVISKLAAHTLQDRGVLSSCEVNIVQLQDLIQAGSYTQERDYLVKNKERMDFIAQTIQAIAETGNTLVLVDRVEAGKLLNAAIPDSNFVYGNTKTVDRQEQYDDISVSDNKTIIATYGVAAVGINIPRIFNLILIEPGKSFIRVVQSIGRGIRKAKDKDHVNIYDICSTAKYSKKHLTERKKYYKEQRYSFNIEKINWQG